MPAVPGRIEKAIVGLRPSFSAHVRWGEHGAPVRFPLTFARTEALSGRCGTECKFGVLTRTL